MGSLIDGVLQETASVPNGSRVDIGEKRTVDPDIPGEPHSTNVRRYQAYSEGVLSSCMKRNKTKFRIKKRPRRGVCLGL